MGSLEEQLSNIERSSQAGGIPLLSFPTLKNLASTDIVTIWAGVSKRVQQQLLKTKPQAVKVPGLGTFHIKKWLSYENGKVQTFQKPVFSLSSHVAEIRELEYDSEPLPEDIKTLLVTSKVVQSSLPYPEEVVKGCLQETLSYFYFILKNREDTNFHIKDVGTLAIRGKKVTMAFSEAFLLNLNDSPYVVEKLIAKRWIILDREAALFPSRFSRVHHFPQFKIQAVPRRISITDKEALEEFDSALGSMGVKGAVQHTLQLLRRGIPGKQLEGAETEKAEGKKREGIDLPERLLPQSAGTEGKKDKEIPCQSSELPLAAAEEQGKVGQKQEAAFEMSSRGKLEASKAKRKEKEEFRRRVGRVTWSEGPQQQGGRENEKLWRAQEEVSTSSAESTWDTGYLEAAEAWIQERRRLRAQLESLGDIEKWLSHKPTLSRQEKRCLRRIKAGRAAQAAGRAAEMLGSLENIPTERKESHGMGRFEPDPVDQSCQPSAPGVDFGKLLEEYSRAAVRTYLESSRLCKERGVPISDRKLQRALLHPGEGQDLSQIWPPPGYAPQPKKADARQLQKSELEKLSDNRFWPGHLLDKLCLYFPEKQHNRAHALFSYVHPTKTSYRGI